MAEESAVLRVARAVHAYTKDVDKQGYVFKRNPVNGDFVVLQDGKAFAVISKGALVVEDIGNYVEANNPNAMDVVADDVAGPLCRDDGEILKALKKRFSVEDKVRQVAVLEDGTPVYVGRVESAGEGQEKGIVFYTADHNMVAAVENGKLVKVDDAEKFKPTSMSFDEAVGAFNSADAVINKQNGKNDGKKADGHFIETALAWAKWIPKAIDDRLFAPNLDQWAKNPAICAAAGIDAGDEEKVKNEKLSGYFVKHSGFYQNDGKTFNLAPNGHLLELVPGTNKKNEEVQEWKAVGPDAIADIILGDPVEIEAAKKLPKLPLKSRLLNGESIFAVGVAAVLGLVGAVSENKGAGVVAMASAAWAVVTEATKFFTDKPLLDHAAIAAANIGKEPGNQAAAPA